MVGRKCVKKSDIGDWSSGSVIIRTYICTYIHDVEV